MDKRAAAAARKIQRQNEYTFRIDHHCYTVARDGVWFLELNTTGLIYATGSIDRLMEFRRVGYIRRVCEFSTEFYFIFPGRKQLFFFFLLFLSSSRKFERFLEMFRERNNKFYFCLLWISNGSKEEYRENVFEEIIKFMILFTNEKKKKEKRKYERRRRTGDFQIFYYIWRNITFSVFKKKKKRKF